MKFAEFVKLYQNSFIIESGTFGAYGDPLDFRRQVNRWVSKNYIHPLKKGVYILNEQYRKNTPSPLFAANQLASPSYVSMEYALGFYGLIPEKVTVITSVTTKKTQKYENVLGRFEYNSISKKLFFGMRQESEGEQKYFIAEPEKALLDFLYFTYSARPDFSYFESMRFQNMDTLNTKRLALYSKKFNKRVKNTVNVLLKYIAQSKKEYKKL